MRSIRNIEVLEPRYLFNADPLVADIDRNGTVEFADFLILSDNFGTSGEESQGDLNGDGVIAFADFLILARAFSTIVEAPAPPNLSLIHI